MPLHSISQRSSKLSANGNHISLWLHGTFYVKLQNCDSVSVHTAKLKLRALSSENLHQICHFKLYSSTFNHLKVK